MLRDFGPNAFVDVLPFENLYTAETEPQVIVMIDDYPALCSTTECGYNYETTDAILSFMAISGKTVQIVTANIPIDDILWIKLGEEQCIIDDITDTAIVCTLESEWVGGDWVPRVMTSMGPIPLASSPTLTYEVVPVIGS